MTRPTHAQAVAAAVALIGTPRTLCTHCGQPTEARSYGGSNHTARSAALAFGLDPQTVYRAVKKQAAQT